MTGRPAKIRNKESRQRKQSVGLIRTEVQVYEQDRDRIHEYAALLRAKRQTEHRESAE